MTTRNDQGPSCREIVLVAGGLALLMAVQLWLSDAFYLFHSHFWVDELFTFAIVSDPDLPHAMEALANVVDTNPPNLHLLLRLWTGLWGLSEVAFRSFALLAMLLALVGIYVVLRDLFAPLPALAGVLAVWCHPLIVRHAFEARFYAPWLAGAVWYAFVLSRALRSPRLGWLVAVAALSVFVCTIHYFGILTLGLITAGELCLSRPWDRRVLWCLAAIVPGPAALAACAPFYLGQRAALTLPTWNQPPDLLGTMTGLAPALAVVCVFYLRGLITARLRPGGDRLGTAGLVALALLPAVLIVFSLLLQPATMARYILPSLAVLGPLVALLVQFLPRAGIVVVCLILAGLSAWGMRNLAEQYRIRDRRTDELIATIRALPGAAPVAFEHVNSLYVIDHYAPEVGVRCFYLDFERDQVPQASNHRIIMRDVARQVARFRGRPGLVGWAEFRKLPARFVVPGEELGEPIHDVEARFPGFELKDMGAGLFELFK